MLDIYIYILYIPKDVILYATEIKAGNKRDNHYYCTINKHSTSLYRVAQKKRPEHSRVLYSSVIDRFLKFLHCYIQR